MSYDENRISDQIDGGLLAELAEIELLELKAKFFCQYYGQNVYRNSKISNGGYIQLSGRNLKNGFLELKSISDISDEDARKLPNRQYNGFEKMYESAQEFLELLDLMQFLTSEEADILKSLGYLIEFNGLSTEELISRGWAVTTNLKTE